MKQVIEELKTGRVRVVENPAPQCGAREILVRNIVSLISPGTEKLMIEMGKKTLVGKAMARPDLVSLAYQKAKKEGFLQVFKEAMSRLDEPLPLGYSCAGEVVEVGSSVQGFSVGDAVACAGHGFASHAEVIVVPPELCVKLPRLQDGSMLSYDEAGFVMLGGIAMQGIRCIDFTAGENIVAVGLGLIGLLLVQIAESYGFKVIGVDVNESKVKLAKELGCKHALVLGKDDVESTILNLTSGHGADAVVLTAATQDNSPVTLAERIARQRGKIVLVGVSDLSLTRKAFWDKELTFTVSKASGPSVALNPNYSILPVELVRWTEKRNLEEFLRLLGDGSINTKKLVTHRFSIENATTAYDMILDGKESYIGVLIDYPNQVAQKQSIELKPAPVRSTDSLKGQNNRMNVGIIGAGLFTKNILLPAIKTVNNVRLVGIGTKTGLSSQHVGNRFGFEYATSEYQKILNDDNIESVIISTRHNLHAKLVSEALAAGKNVFVEKPLCILKEDINLLVDSFNNKPREVALMVGFNRRYSPLSKDLREALSRRIAPLQAHFRVNASFIPPEHWTQDPNIGGGRIIGEVCHFVDYLQYLTNSDPIEVFATSIAGSMGKYQSDDNIIITLRFADGSLGSIMYTALGTKTFSRERVELFWDESAAVLEDFRSLEYFKGTSKKKKKLWNQDMGYKNELADFFSSPVERTNERFRQAILTTLATFGATESLRTNKPVAIAEVRI